jgi:signal transduction histidine kinase
MGEDPRTAGTTVTGSSDAAVTGSGDPEEIRQEIDFDFLAGDLPMLLDESQEGIAKVCKIVQDLRDFSRAGYEEQWTLADLHRGLDSTLNIVWNDLKYKCEILRSYGEIPDVECLPSQLNQVFLNILVNAGHAIEQRGTIRVTTGQEDDRVFIEIADTGKGIAQENIARIFDPFFTTKPVGQGTGLGLSLSYSIVRKHNGHISVDSKIGGGTRFRIVLPIRQQRPGEASLSPPLNAIAGASAA